MRPVKAHIAGIGTSLLLVACVAALLATAGSLVGYREWRAPEEGRAHHATLVPRSPLAPRAAVPARPGVPPSAPRRHRGVHAEPGSVAVRPAPSRVQAPVALTPAPRSAPPVAVAPPRVRPPAPRLPAGRPGPGPRPVHPEPARPPVAAATPAPAPVPGPAPVPAPPAHPVTKMVASVAEGLAPTLEPLRLSP